MESSNSYRNKCLQLVCVLEQKNKEIKELESLLESQSTLDNPALAAMDIFCKTLVTAQRNGMVYHKEKVTARGQSFAEINYRNFWDVTQGEMPQGVTPEDLSSYKDVLQALQLVHQGSFESGGIPSRVEGRTMRVVRVPERVYALLAAEEGGPT